MNGFGIQFGGRIEVCDEGAISLRVSVLSSFSVEMDVFRAYKQIYLFTLIKIW